MAANLAGVTLTKPDIDAMQKQVKAEIIGHNGTTDVATAGQVQEKETSSQMICNSSFDKIFNSILFEIIDAWQNCDFLAEEKQ